MYWIYEFANWLNIPVNFFQLAFTYLCGKGKGGAYAVDVHSRGLCTSTASCHSSCHIGL